MVLYIVPYAVHVVVHIHEMHRKYVAESPNSGFFLLGAYHWSTYTTFSSGYRERRDVLNSVYIL